MDGIELRTGPNLRQRQDKGGQNPGIQFLTGIFNGFKHLFPLLIHSFQF